MKKQKPKTIHTPKISVVMPAYNVEKYIAESIESILNQTFKDLELIIVNDASTDNTLSVIREYKNKDKRIKILSNTKNLYATISRNEAIRISKGEYIAIQDADDVSEKTRLQIQYDYLEEHKDIFLLGTGAINIDEMGRSISCSRPISNVKKLKEILEKQNAIYHPTVMFRAEKGLLYREKMYYSEDYDFYLVLLSKGKTLNNISDTLVKYRVLKNSVSHSKAAKQYLFADKARKFYIQRLKYGKDEYNNFQPKEILEMNSLELNDKEALKFEIKASFKTKDKTKARELSKRYFKKYGYFNKVLLYLIRYF